MPCGDPEDDLHVSPAVPQELDCPLPGNLPRWCDLRLALGITELKRSASCLPSYTVLPSSAACCNAAQLSTA